MLWESKETHIARHKELHEMLDELVCDWLAGGAQKGENRFPSESTIQDLVKWSHEQTLIPENNGIKNR